MPQHYALRTPRTLDYALVAGAACLSIYWWYLRPLVYQDSRRSQNRVIRCNAREAARSILLQGTKSRSSAVSTGSAEEEPPPYQPDAFPGARDAETAYGTIKVFEWGPEHGEKVLLLHGIGTPCVALGDMARQFARRGCRVMMFAPAVEPNLIADKDLFGRGYSDAPGDLLYDDRLYTTQILLVLASSPLPWTGTSAFHIVGYSLGGALAASFAAYHANVLRSATFICPGGLIRPSHVSFKSRIFYSEGILPSWLLSRLAKQRLEPKPGTPSADVPDPEAALDKVDGRDADEVVFDQVPVRADDASGPKVGDVVKWQLRNNAGFVPAYVSSIRHAPIYGHHDDVWKLLGEQLAWRRRGDESRPGLPGGKICLILAERDPIVIKEEWIADSIAVLGEDAVDIRIIKGGHEIAISKGREVADVTMASWR